MGNERSAFLKALKKKKGRMSAQEYRTIKGQAIKGDISSARKGMNKVIRRRGLR